MQRIWKIYFAVFMMICIIVSVLPPITVNADASGNSRSGTWSLEGELSGNTNWGGFVQDVTLQAGVTYTYSAWIKGEGGDIGLIIQNPGWSGVSWHKKTAEDGVWQLFETEYTVPADASGVYHAQIADVYVNPGNPKTVYIDDVFLGVKGGSINLLSNGGFESGPTDTSWAAGGPFNIKNFDLTAESLIDDDFNAVYEQSSNMGIDSSNTGNFGGDNARATRNTNADGYLIYKTDFDISSLSVKTYNWTDVATPDLRLEASPDGISYTPVELDKYTFSNSVSGSWPITIYEAHDFPDNTAYLKITLPYNGADAPWAEQIAKVVINANTAPVIAIPGTSKIEGPTEISLSTRTPGATIYYKTEGDEYMEYTGPFTIEHSTRITAFARKEGKLDSMALTYNYTSPVDETVDRFGQIKSASFPNKVTDESQLVEDITADQAYYDSLTPPERDIYGGLLGSKEQYDLEATGYFHTETLNGKSVMVDPIGNLYFSLGVNGVGYVGETYTQVTGREYLYEWLPEYGADSEYATAFKDPNPTNFSFYLANRIRKTGEPFDQEAYYKESVERVKKWGFTTAGAWSTEGYEDEVLFPGVAFLEPPSDLLIPGSHLYDPFKPGFEEALDAKFTAPLEARKNDEQLIGYMFGNELPYDRIKNTIPAAKASEVGSKGRLVDMLIEVYDNDISAFNTAWNKSATSFDELKEQSLSVTTDEAVIDMDNFTQIYLDAYYGKVAAAFRKVDSNHMLIGDRWLAGVMNDDKLRGYLATAAGKYLDVLSYNYYTYDFNLDRIETMYEQSGGKPMIFTEFHYGEPTSGLTFGVRLADNEHQKGLMYRNYVEKAAASGFVVGTHWFVYLDQAPTGRWFQGLNGEAGAIGLLNVADRPYTDFLNSVMETNYNIYDVVEGKTAPYQYSFAPSQGERDSHKVLKIPYASAPIVVNGVKDESWPAGDTATLTDLDRVLGTMKLGVSADMNLAWDETHLYLYAHMNDSTPMVNVNSGDGVWDGDAVELFVGPENVNQGGSIQFRDSQLVLAGALKDGVGQYYWYNGAEQTPVEMAVVMDEDGKGYSIEAAIPMVALKITDPSEGRELRFDIGFDDAGVKSRERQFLWNGVDGNAQNREKWGKAVLIGATPATNPVHTDAGDNKESVKDPKVRLITKDEVDKAISGKKISLKLDEGVQQIVISTEAIGSLKGKTLEIQVGDVTLILPELVVQNLRERIDLIGGNGTAISIAIKPLEATEADSLSVDIPEGVSLRAAGEAIDLSLSVVGADKLEYPVTQFDEPVTVTFKLDLTSVSAELLGLYYYNEQTHAWKYVGGNVDTESGTLTAKLKHFSTYSVMEYNKTFKDIPAGSELFDAVQALSAKHIVNGMTKTEFGLNGSLTRAQFAAMLTRALGLVAKNDVSFSDVAKNDWYASSVSAVFEAGIVKGRGADIFAPNDQITRQEMAVMMVRAYEFATGRPAPKASVSYSDAAQISSGQYISRGEAAIVLYRYLKLK